MNKAQILHAKGLSLWYDNIERTMLENGAMKALIDSGSIYGVTSNPSIFEASIGHSNAYDESLQAMAWAGLNTEQIYQQLVIADIQKAADLFRPLYDASNKKDGYVSLEVSPLLAYQSDESISEAHALWKAVNRPNLMIKIPATIEGCLAIQSLIADGINVNATLIFSVERYRKVMKAFINGLQIRHDNGLPLEGVAGVASFFISRIDSEVDALLEKSENPLARDLCGNLAVDNARLAYQAFKEEFSAKNFGALLKAGAQVQRPLWASTGTKNPKYSPTLYVDQLVAKNSVNTVPPKTLKAYLESGQTEESIAIDVDRAECDFATLTDLGISMDDVCKRLEADGVSKFEDAYRTLLASIEKKRKDFCAQLGPLQIEVKNGFESAVEERYVERLFAHDPSVWTQDESAYPEIRERLGWLDLPGKQFGLADELKSFAEDVQVKGFTQVFVLGMGGSSLAPEVLSLSFAPVIEHGLKLQIIDTTNPDEIRARFEGVDLLKTLFIVSSKSGGTSETLSALKYFTQELHKLGVQVPGAHFVAITDPGTSLQQYATENAFYRIFNAPANVGGRYSVFTPFGLVPAALIGIDLLRFLGQGALCAEACGEAVPTEANPGLMLGLAMAEGAKAGRDKLSFIAESYASNLVPWIEQLVAESSGKKGRGILPIEGEPVPADLKYGNDRLFVYYHVDGSRKELVDALNAAGHCVLRLSMSDVYQLGREFYRWEYATAVACMGLGVNAFDQPDVQTNKTLSKRIIADYQQKHCLDEGTVIWENDEAAVYGQALEGLSMAASLADLIRLYLGALKEHGFVVLSAYLPRLQAEMDRLQSLRASIQAQSGVATILGFGPRFLHSTGQLHKGGQAGGLFLIFTRDAKADIEIPGEGISFGNLQKAQALGDLEALLQEKRLAIRIHLKNTGKPF